MIEHIITSTVLIILIAAVSALFEKRINPRIRYALWLLVACKLLLPVPEFETSISVMNVVQLFEEKDTESSIPYIAHTQPAMISSEIMKAQSVEEEFITEANEDIAKNSTYKLSMADICKGIWILGAVICFSVFLWSNVRYSLQMKKQRKWIQKYKNTLAVYEVKGIASPCLFGTLKPEIYVPEGNGLTDEQFEYVLAHEYTHYKHGDFLWVLVRCLCVILYWYNPFVWLAAHISMRDGEFACDAGTIRRIGEENHINYGKMLIEMAQNTSKQPYKVHILGCLSSATGGTNEMKKRIQLIAKRPQTKGTAVLALTLAGIGMVGCTFGSAETENNTSLYESVNVMQEKSEDMYGALVPVMQEKLAAAEEMSERMKLVEEYQQEVDQLIAEEEAKARQQQWYQKITREQIDAELEKVKTEEQWLQESMSVSAEGLYNEFMADEWLMENVSYETQDWYREVITERMDEEKDRLIAEDTQEKLHLAKQQAEQQMN